MTQEHLLQGGDHYRHVSPTTRRVSHRQTGAVRSIDDTSKLNRALWTLAQGMADLKAGAPHCPRRLQNPGPTEGSQGLPRLPSRPLAHLKPGCSKPCPATLFPTP